MYYWRPTKEHLLEGTWIHGFWTGFNYLVAPLKSTPCLQIAVKTGDQNPDGLIHPRAEEVDWYIGLLRNEKTKRLEAKEAAY